MWGELLNDQEVVAVTSLSNEDLLNLYVQAQFLMCLRGVQAMEKEEPISNIWADFGRYKEERVTRLLHRIEDDPEYAKGVLSAFEEDSSVFLGNLTRRLKIIRTSFWQGGSFSWDSITEWRQS